MSGRVLPGDMKNKPTVSSENKEDMAEKNSGQSTLVPPDGGYGWAVAFALFLILGTTIPVQLVFGLLYRDVFIDLQFSPTDISVLMNVNVGVGQGFALFNAPLIRRYGYRKMSVVGATLMTVGMVLTSIAVTRVQFLIVYGITASLGFGMVLQSSQVAFNAYFKEKKSKAMGIAMTGVGVCMILAPQLVVALLKVYGPRGACLIMGGVVMQSFVGSALLQPVKYHLKRKLLDPEQPHLQPQDNINATEETDKGNNSIKSELSKSQTESMRNEDKEDTEEAEEPLLKQNQDDSLHTKTVSSPEEETQEKTELLDMQDDDPEQEDDKGMKENHVKTSKSSLQMSSNTENSGGKTAEKKGIISVLLSKISTVLDLSLLTNVVYANIIVGMSLAFASETNFSMMTPLILASMGFSSDKVATIMSTMSIIDILARFLTPFALGRFKISARIMYFVSIFLLVIFRSILVLLTTFESVMILGVGLGVAKGIRNVYINLVIPSHVPNERLASAIGLNMTFSAMLFLCFGPLLGLAVEKGGDYDSCVLTINGLTLIAIVMWLLELVVFRKKANLKDKSVP